ncbi:MAG: transglutaminase domain-containing protein [Phycisphaerales bacterium]|nr:transglutaminase domain-containing protein [Phycisphaerales bacterium]
MRDYFHRIAICAAACFVTAAYGQVDRLDPVARKAIHELPIEWQVISSNEIDAAQVQQIGQRLGADVRGLSNAVFSVMGKRIQVNTIVCVDSQAAEAVLAGLRQSKPAFACRAVGPIAIEFVGQDDNLIRRAGYDLKLAPRPEHLRYRVRVRVAPLKRCPDYMKWNGAVNAIVAAEADKSNASLRAQRDELLAGFEFGDQLILGKHAGLEYTFDPAPAREDVDNSRGLARYQFKDLPRQDDIPYVTMTATYTTGGNYMSDPRKPSAACTKSTADWPADDPELRKLADEVTAGAKSDADAVDALLRWLRPNVNIRFAGQTGSRYGVTDVLSQKRGHCWDFSDLFITLCRAKGIPARQIAGWIYGGEGHVWAEVWIDGHWKQVDATGGGMVDCEPYHIGYVVSENGGMPMLYVTLPEIELLNFEE